ncbi:PREDICTED: reverse mRNAase [Prunus dulcis]|uniref:PREDICTED: reverse mRNAase n=1 Tax=Prunus dulcis TaxID=3755 RepID=A0A5E4GH10_PRUDU|nr:hypothetical protein L3X38_037594 [Prunus dulcis]VVA38808.1 PREDICTED: reverse mRNAase [Prunus dulcis]
MKVIQQQLGLVGSYSVCKEWLSGGLSLLWHHGVEVQVLSSSPVHIDVVLRDQVMGYIWLTRIYGNPNTSFRRHSWQLLRHIAGMVSRPWLVGSNSMKLLRVMGVMGVAIDLWHKCEIFGRL